MIYVTQLVYVRDGQEDMFNRFESMAMPLIAKYNGTLLLRLRPSEECYIELHMERPYEVHLVTFPEKQDLDNFMQDETRKNFLHLKTASVKSTLVVCGTRL